MALSASQVYAKVFQSLTGVNPDEEKWVSEMYTVAKEYIDAGTFQPDDALLFDVILSDEKAPQAYKDRFKAITILKEKKSSFIPSVTEYLNMEKRYKEVLKATGLGDLGTNEQISTFIANEVSADEMSDRITKAFVAIDTADEVTRGVLTERFPGLTRQDVARGLLLGRDSTYELTKKIEGARVVSEARRAGLAAPKLSEQEVVSRGLTQEELRKGFGEVARQRTGISQAERTFGRPLGDTQKALEQEVLMGDEQAGREVRALRSQARAEFGGTSGIVTGSLSKRRGKTQL